MSNNGTDNFAALFGDFKDVLGYEPSDIETGYVHICPEDAAEVRDAERRAWLERTTQIVDFRSFRDEGSAIHLETTFHPVVDENGRVTHVGGIVIERRVTTDVEPALTLSNLVGIAGGAWPGTLHRARDRTCPWWHRLCHLERQRYAVLCATAAQAPPPRRDDA